MTTPRPHGLVHLLIPTLLAAALWIVPGPATAQFADLDRADWKEGAIPPPPAYDASRLIELDTPPGSAVHVGIDPDTIRLDVETGIVRYVAVARGPSAVNAMYEGIRCATGEYRVYARQVQGGPWTQSDDISWKSMRALGGGVRVLHPFQLARDGLCVGASMRSSAQEMVRELRTGNRSLYY